MKHTDDGNGGKKRGYVLFGWCQIGDDTKTMNGVHPATIVARSSGVPVYRVANGAQIRWNAEGIDPAYQPHGNEVFGEPFAQPKPEPGFAHPPDPLEPDDDPGDSGWRKHVGGRVRVVAPAATAAADLPLPETAVGEDPAWGDTPEEREAALPAGTAPQGSHQPGDPPPPQDPCDIDQLDCE